LTYRALLKCVERHARPARIAQCLERCRIRGVQRRLLGSLSKGYRQRVGLADAMLHDPQLLILDEPTDGLDPGQKAETLGMLRDLGKTHTIILSSHMLSEVETLVNRVIILRRGHLGMAKKLSDLDRDDVIVVEVRGPVDQVVNTLRTMEGVASVTSEPLGDGLATYLVRTHRQQDLREAIGQRIAKSGWALRRLDLRRRSLQDRWNEINNFEDFDVKLPVAPSRIGPPPVDSPGSSAVTTP
jgi:ABC-2 type transport system ATP-binding protein